MTQSQYPPPEHVLRDLEITTEATATDRCVSAIPCPEWIRDRAGGVAIGALAALTDVTAARVALVAGHPKWTATIDLELHLTGNRPGAVVVADARLVRVGSNIVVVACTAYDTGHDDPDAALDAAVAGAAAAVPVASGLITFARIPRSASAAAATFDAADLIGSRTSMSAGRPPRSEGWRDRIGARIVDAASGVVEIDRTEYTRNSFGAINGGVHGMVFQAAAEAFQPGFVATDLHVHYLAQVKAGPGRTTAAAVRDHDDHVVCSVAMVDAGHDDLLMSTGTVILGRLR